MLDVLAAHEGCHVVERNPFHRFEFGRTGVDPGHICLSNVDSQWYPGHMPINVDQWYCSSSVNGEYVG